MSTKRFEFSYMWEGVPHFATIYDTNIVSAAERLLNRPVMESEFVVSPTGNKFICGWSGTQMTVTENVFGENGGGRTPQIHPSELTRKIQPKVASVLEGLI